MESKRDELRAIPPNALSMAPASRGLTYADDSLDPSTTGLVSDKNKFDDYDPQGVYNNNQIQVGQLTAAAYTAAAYEIVDASNLND